MASTNFCERNKSIPVFSANSRPFFSEASNRSNNPFAAATTNNNGLIANTALNAAAPARKPNMPFLPFAISSFAFLNPSCIPFLILSDASSNPNAFDKKPPNGILLIAESIVEPNSSALALSESNAS